MDVSKIGGKSGKTVLHSVAGAIPAQECLNSKSMTEVVQAWSMAIELATQARLPRQSMERPPDVVFVQWSSSFGNEEKVGSRPAIQILIST
jgi:hypothetical protein